MRTASCESSTTPETATPSVPTRIVSIASFFHNFEKCASTMPPATRFTTFRDGEMRRQALQLHRLRLTDEGFEQYRYQSSTSWLELHAIDGERTRLCCMAVHYILSSLHLFGFQHTGRRDDFVPRTVVHMYNRWLVRCHPDPDWRRELTPAHFWHYLRLCCERGWLAEA